MRTLNITHHINLSILWIWWIITWRRVNHLKYYNSTEYCFISLFKNQHVMFDFFLHCFWMRFLLFAEVMCISQWKNFEQYCSLFIFVCSRLNRILIIVLYDFTIRLDEFMSITNNQYFNKHFTAHFYRLIVSCLFLFFCFFFFWLIWFFSIAYDSLKFNFFRMNAVMMIWCVQLTCVISIHWGWWIMTIYRLYSMLNSIMLNECRVDVDKLDESAWMSKKGFAIEMNTLRLILKYYSTIFEGLLHNITLTDIR